MFQFYCCLQALEYIIISDPKDTPIRSSAPFNTIQDKLLYYTISQYIYSSMYTYIIKTIIRDLNKYVRLYSKNNQNSTLLIEIKLLLITDIMVRYQMTSISLDMLDLAKDFDDNLLHHLCVIRSSRLNNFKSFDASSMPVNNNPCYILNRSVNFVIQTYITLLYEMMLLLGKQNKWHWQTSSFFRQQIMRERGRTDRFDCFTIYENSCSVTSIDFELSEIFTQTLDIKELDKLFEKQIKKSIYLVLLYTQSNMLRVLDDYLEDNRFIYTLDSVKHSELVFALLENPNFEFLYFTYMKLRGKRYIFKLVLHFYKPAKYEFFFNEGSISREADTYATDEAFTYYFDIMLAKTNAIIEKFTQCNLLISKKALYFYLYCFFLLLDCFILWIYNGMRMC